MKKSDIEQIVVLRIKTTSSILYEFGFFSKGFIKRIPIKKVQKKLGLRKEPKKSMDFLHALSVELLCRTPAASATAASAAA